MGVGGERSELFLCEHGVVDDEDVGEGSGDDGDLHTGKIFGSDRRREWGCEEGSKRRKQAEID